MLVRRRLENSDNRSGGLTIASSILYTHSLLLALYTTNISGNFFGILAWQQSSSGGDHRFHGAE